MNYQFPFTNGCHGCGGKGWVSPSYGVAVKCPVCNGSGAAQSKPSVSDETYWQHLPKNMSSTGGDIPSGM